MYERDTCDSEYNLLKFILLHNNSCHIKLHIIKLDFVGSYTLIQVLDYMSTDSIIIDLI